jgi:alanine dehydrogenase
MSIQAAASHLEKTHGGLGVLIAGVPGVAPAKIVILGEIAQHAGWKQRDLLARLTKSKTERIAAGAKALKATNKLRAQARKNVEERFKEDQKVLAPLAM